MPRRATEPYRGKEVRQTGFEPVSRADAGFQVQYGYQFRHWRTPFLL